MCGIAGILGAAGPQAIAAVEAMVAAQAHRGPDGSGTLPLPGAVLGHNRLAIIDLSQAGAQPMASADGRHVLVYNGEIYNFADLRSELEPGHQFRSHSDSEVLLAAFRAWGPACLDRLRGMFAFCVYDTETRTAFLARDRFGQKPLHVARQQGAVLFASEVKALLAAGVPARPNRVTWARYLVTAEFDVDRDTFFEGVEQLEPGECAWWDPVGGLVRHRWYAPGQAVRPRAADASADELRAMLADVGRIHMRADVPVGVSLSGGLDSSALLAAVAEGGALTDRTACFSVEFGADYSERPWVESAASAYGLRVHMDSFDPVRFRDSIAPLVWHLEGPVGGLMNCGRGACVARARANGFPVLLDGTGIDEAFGGYRNHQNLYLGQVLLQRGAAAETALADYARVWGVSTAKARAIAEGALAAGITAIDGTSPARPDLVNEQTRDLVAALPQAAPAFPGDPLRSSLADYLMRSKIPRNMRMMDRLSMAFGLETRMPFLDHPIVEFGLGLPPGQWFGHGLTKWGMRDALAGLLPDEVRLAAKRSVHTPQTLWLRDAPMRDYVRSLIESDSFADRGLFDVAAVRRAFDRFCAEGADNSLFVWQWINVEEWFRVFIDKIPAPSIRQVYS